MNPFSPFHPLNWKTGAQEERAPGVSAKHEVNANEVLVAIAVVLLMTWLCSDLWKLEKRTR